MRACGDCQLCCRLMPMAAEAAESGRNAMRLMVEHGLADPALLKTTIPDFDKPAGERCRHQKFHKGCTIYNRRPFGCRFWNCRWLVNDDTADLSRPDHSHYVIDMMPDVIRVTPNDRDGKPTGPPQEIQCVVVWVDPAHRDAHRDPALRRYLMRRAENEGMGALIRWSENDGMALLAPVFDAQHKGEWYEQESRSTPGFLGLSKRLAIANKEAHANDDRD